MSLLGEGIGYWLLFLLAAGILTAVAILAHRETQRLERPLGDLTWAGLARRRPTGKPSQVRAAIYATIQEWERT